MVNKLAAPQRGHVQQPRGQPRGNGPREPRVEEPEYSGDPLDDQKMAPIFIQGAKKYLNLVPGMGIGTPAWDPEKGLQSYARDREAEKWRVQQALQRLGLSASPSVQRMNMSPMQAILHAKGRNNGPDVI